MTKYKPETLLLCRYIHPSPLPTHKHLTQIVCMLRTKKKIIRKLCLRFVNSHLLYAVGINCTGSRSNGPKLWREMGTRKIVARVPPLPLHPFVVVITEVEANTEGGGCCYSIVHLAQWEITTKTPPRYSSTKCVYYRIGTAVGLNSRRMIYSLIFR